MAEPGSNNNNVTFDLGIFIQLLWISLSNIIAIAKSLFRIIFPAKEKDIANQVVLVTGSAKGLGRGLCLEFARQGCKVICVDVDSKGNEETVEKIQNENGPDTARGYICDVSDFASVEQLKNKVLKDFDHVDILVNNAGIIYDNIPLSGEVADVKRVVDVNLLAAIWMTRTFVPEMKTRRQGHVVFTNSVSSMFPIPEASIYTTTKCALSGFTHTLLLETQRDPELSFLKITSVHPFFIATDGVMSSEKAKAVKSKLSVEKAAQEYVQGVRREYFELTIPGFQLGYSFLMCYRLLPTSTMKQLSHFFNCLLHPNREAKKMQG